MDILILQFEEQGDHIVSLPTLGDEPVVIQLPTVVRFVVIDHSEAVTKIYATDKVVIAGWEDG